MSISLITALKTFRTKTSILLIQIDGMRIRQKIILTPGSFKPLSGRTCRYGATHSLSLSIIKIIKFYLLHTYYTLYQTTFHYILPRWSVAPSEGGTGQLVLYIVKISVRNANKKELGPRTSAVTLKCLHKKIKDSQKNPFFHDVFFLFPSVPRKR